MLKVIQNSIDTPLKWYATRFKLTPKEVKFSVRLFVVSFILINLVLAILVIVGVLAA